MNKPIPDPDEESPDEELVAYLDGEVDPASAREIERKVAEDQTTRTRVRSLKKTYDLLDYLPRSEPSADFATKTVTQILPLNSSANDSAAGVELYRPSGMAWPWLTIAAAVAVILGLVLGLTTRPGPPREEPLTPDLLPLLARLPLYVGVDDLEFLRALDRPELFAEAVDEFHPHIDVSFERPISPDLQQKHFEYFRQLPASRRRDIVALDKQLHELPANERDRLGLVLENYAVWLDSLPAALRKEVLDAPNREERLKVIEEVQVKHWQDTLPNQKKQEWKLTTGAVRKAELLRGWQEAEQNQKEEWLNAAKQWHAVKEGKKPWPFSDETLRAEIDSYVKNVLKLDPKLTRLSSSELQRLTFIRRETDLDRGWLQYGTLLLELSERYKSLPEPRVGPPITKLDQLNDAIRKRITPFPRKLAAVESKVGKWPEFALAVHLELNDKSIASANQKLGPAKPGEFTEPVDQFLSNGLIPRLSNNEKQRLRSLEGKWPEYPIEMRNLAGSKDLSIPGVSLPGTPSLWKQHYRYTPNNSDKPAISPTGK